MPSANSAETAILAEQKTGTGKKEILAQKTNWDSPKRKSSTEIKTGTGGIKMDVAFLRWNEFSEESQFSGYLILSCRANTDETVILEKVGRLPKLYEIGSYSYSEL